MREQSSRINRNKYGDDSEKDPPVPIPNTVVKLLCAEDSEGLPFVKAGRCRSYISGGLAQLGEHLPYKQGVTGSSPVTSIPEPLAQSVEHLTFNQRVVGSIPTWLIRKQEHIYLVLAIP